MIYLYEKNIKLFIVRLQADLICENNTMNWWCFFFAMSVIFSINHDRIIGVWCNLYTYIRCEWRLYILVKLIFLFLLVEMIYGNSYIYLSIQGKKKACNVYMKMDLFLWLPLSQQPWSMDYEWRQLKLWLGS